MKDYMDKIEKIKTLIQELEDDGYEPHLALLGMVFNVKDKGADSAGIAGVFPSIPDYLMRVGSSLVDLQLDEETSEMYYQVIEPYLAITAMMAGIEPIRTVEYLTDIAQRSIKSADALRWEKDKDWEYNHAILNLLELHGKIEKLEDMLDRAVANHFEYMKERTKKA